MNIKSVFIRNCLNFPRAAIGNFEREISYNSWLQFVNSHRDKSHRGTRMRLHAEPIVSKLCEGTIVRHRDNRRRRRKTPAGSCKYSGRPARSNIIIAPSSTRRDADEYHEEAPPSAFSARCWHVDRENILRRYLRLLSYSGRD